jgi:hypothetical protein
MHACSVKSCGFRGNCLPAKYEGAATATIRKSGPIDRAAKSDAGVETFSDDVRESIFNGHFHFDIRKFR